MELVRLESPRTAASAGRRPAVTVGQLRRRAPRAPGAGGGGGRATRAAAAGTAVGPDLRPASRRACSRPERAPATLMTARAEGRGAGRRWASTAWPCCPSRRELAARTAGGVRARRAARRAGRARGGGGRQLPLRPRARAATRGRCARWARGWASRCAASSPCCTRARRSAAPASARRWRAGDVETRRAACWAGASSWTARWWRATAAGARSASRPRTSRP